MPLRAVSDSDLGSQGLIGTLGQVLMPLRAVSDSDAYNPTIGDAPETSLNALTGSQ